VSAVIEKKAGLIETRLQKIEFTPHRGELFVIKKTSSYAKKKGREGEEIWRRGK